MSNTETINELHNFQNPKGSVSAVIIRNGQMVLLKRKNEPYKGMWDLPGGYMNSEETPIEAIKREIKEEMGIEIEPEYIDVFTGWAEWKGERFPVLNFAFLAVIGDEKITLNDENISICWQTIQFMLPDTIAFDSNQKIAQWVRQNLNFDMERVKELVSQLDKTASVNELSLYKAVLNGHVAKKYEDQKLIGLGWIFPRQTMLRKQAVVEDVIVDESYRGKGFGKEIMIELHKWAKSQGVKVIELTTNPKRIAANGLYKNLGYRLHETNHYLFDL